MTITNEQEYEQALKELEELEELMDREDDDYMRMDELVDAIEEYEGANYIIVPDLNDDPIGDIYE